MNNSLPAVLYGFETWSVSLRGELDEVVRKYGAEKVLGFKRYEVRADWK